MYINRGIVTLAYGLRACRCRIHIAYPRTSIHFLCLRMWKGCILPPVAVSAIRIIICGFHIVLQKDMAKRSSIEAS